MWVLNYHRPQKYYELLTDVTWRNVQFLAIMVGTLRSVVKSVYNAEQCELFACAHSSFVLSRKHDVR